jgi:hypothetical protein
MKIIIGVSGFAFRRFLDLYGDEIVAYASRKGEDAARQYGPQVVRWTADTSRTLYGAVSPRAADLLARVKARRGGKASGVILPGADDEDSSRLGTMLAGPYADDLQRIGAYVRSAADFGVEQLRTLSDEQLGAIAVAFWNAQNRDGRLGRRLRSMIWPR